MGWLDTDTGDRRHIHQPNGCVYGEHWWNKFLNPAANCIAFSLQTGHKHTCSGVIHRISLFYLQLFPWQLAIISRPRDLSQYNAACCSCFFRPSCSDGETAPILQGVPLMRLVVMIFVRDDDRIGQRRRQRAVTPKGRRKAIRINQRDTPNKTAAKTKTEQKGANTR